MTEWDGRGLPPVAAARMQRFAASGVRTSLLDVAGAASVTGVGLAPVGEVMGCIVEHIGWGGWRGCGYATAGFGANAGWATRTVTSSDAAYGGYKPYVDALYRGYDTALARMLTEAAAMRADGVVGVRLTVTELGTGNHEFVALGTAVRGEDAPAHPAQPFVTDLPGADVAKLLHAGWVPVALVLGISVAIRHDDYTTRAQARAYGSNVEVSGYTELVQHVRADARRRFERRCAAGGADGAVVSDLSLRMWEIEPSDGHRDHVAQATVTGTSIAEVRHRAPAPTRALGVLPLRPVRPATGGPR